MIEDRRSNGGGVLAFVLVLALVLGLLVGSSPSRSGAQGAAIDGSWQLRICFSSALKQSDSRLAGYEKGAFATTFAAAAADGSMTGVVSNYPLGRITLVGRWDGSTLAVANWYLGAPSGATQGTASLTVRNGVLSGPWRTVKGSIGTWIFTRSAPPACGATAVSAKTVTTTAKPKIGGPVRLKVVTTQSDDGNSQFADGVTKTLTVGGQSVTTDSGGVARIVVPQGVVSVQGTGLSSIVVSETASGTNTVCAVTGASGSVSLGAARAPDSSSDYTIAIRFAPNQRTGVPACNGQAPGSGRTAAGPGRVVRFDATVEMPGFPMLTRNCGTIASQFITVSVHGGYVKSGEWQGGGSISELPPKDVVPPNPSTPPDCAANNLTFWAYGGTLDVKPVDGGTVRTLTLNVWVSGGDQSVPQQCNAPDGAARREGTITLVDSDEFLRPQNITADAIVVGPFGAGCTAHDREFSNVAFVSGIGAIPKAIVEVQCESDSTTGLSGKNC